MSTFDGWPGTAISFFAGLEEDNSKAYWQANRRIYDRDVRDPMEALLAMAAPEFGPGRMYRPNRDVRFSRDKSPYHVHISALAGIGPALNYVGLKADCLIAGTGLYEADRPLVTALRAVIADDRLGPEVVELVEHLEGEGFIVSGDALRVAPRGFPPDHPRIRLLRRQTLIVARSWPPGPWLPTMEAADRVLGAWRACRPLQHWLNEHLPGRGGGGAG